MHSCRHLLFPRRPTSIVALPQATAAALSFAGYHPHQVRHIVAHYHKLPELLFFTKPDTPADSRVFLPQAEPSPSTPNPDPSPNPNPNQVPP